MSFIRHTAGQTWDPFVLLPLRLSLCSVFSGGLYCLILNLSSVKGQCNFQKVKANLAAILM